ncbi:hypothetical protein QTL97_11975 [Sporosarcina thermotolerans]|uniref:Uncharacterized protein n=1 Tax=Sporosarcina thermotolerans TaxID=633404 RepID=A0AAW9A891_9BACL|nr:hypothetical protein [Sporosarcina thermotolerans]MDW0117657.1 hypothetical protein [Sporosarcina thermotolerans]WHT49248.1 hypothetical protein QNH10_06430 [Sporosarcina thermotolerans]
MGYLGLLMALLPIIIFIAIIIFIVKTVKGFEKRAEEKLALEREQNAILQQKMSEMNTRITSIEKMLKEVE